MIRPFRFSPSLRLPFFTLSCLCVFLAFSCRGTPDAAPPPVFSLVFDRVEASGSNAALCFVLKAENPRNSAAVLGVTGYSFFLDGTETRGILEFPARDGEERKAPKLDSGSRIEIPLKIILEPKNIAGFSNTASDKPLEAALRITLTVMFDDGKKSSVPVKGQAELSRIQEPSFAVSSITIMQAELINTRLKVRLRVGNPNPFPVDMSSFAYELYGAGRFWAGGTEKNVFSVPAGAQAEKELFLVMNFIDMRRDLLDQVIAMEKVSYRFTGTVEVKTGIAWFPVFTQRFDMEGESEVTK